MLYKPHKSPLNYGYTVFEVRVKALGLQALVTENVRIGITPSP